MKVPVGQFFPLDQLSVPLHPKMTFLLLGGMERCTVCNYYLLEIIRQLPSILGSLAYILCNIWFSVRVHATQVVVRKI
jgi:hypothetical protein